MSNKTYIKAIYACLLALVFVCAQLMSPLHFAFMHHDQIHTRENKTPMFSVHEKECVYCDFHFFHFINQSEIYQDVIHIRHIFSEKAQNLITIFINSGLHESVLGRAPPLVINFPEHNTASFNNQKYKHLK